MNTVARSGLLCYGVALVAIGAIHFISGHSPSGLMPMPDTAPGHELYRYLDGIILVITGACLVLSVRTLWAALTAAALLFVMYLFLGLVREIVNPGDSVSWTGPAEILCLCAGALIVARGSGARAWTFFAARCLLALGLCIIGIEHFIYAKGVATIVPAWFPWRVFWAYFVGAALIGLAISLLGNVFLKWTSLLAAIMFLSWLPLLHGPRVAANPQTETEWTSFFVALAVGGIFLILSGSARPSPQPLSQTAPI